jgi:SAM-dependent MidA family methyltransferase
MSLLDFLLDRIESSGPMPFAAFMSFALYHPRFGYYSAGPERTGWRGHFLTSPEIDPAFGALWARALETIWDACGRPPAFEVVEIGPGEGGLASGVLDVARPPFADALSYRLVERIPALEQRQRDRLSGHANVTWSRSIMELAPVPAGCVFANEVLDNLPVHLVERTNGALAEVCVDAAGGSLAFVSLPPSSPELERWLERVGVELPDGHRMEVPLAAESLAARVAGLVGRGAALFVDYGANASALAARPDGSLVAYSGAGVDEDVLDAPGTKDLTTHANWTSVARVLAGAGLSVAGPRPQRDVLMALGARSLDDELKSEHARALAEGRGAQAVRALSRRQALAALIDPGGLGRLDVLGGFAAIDPPAWMTSRE